MIFDSLWLESIFLGSQTTLSRLYAAQKSRKNISTLLPLAIEREEVYLEMKSLPK